MPDRKPLTVQKVAQILRAAGFKSKSAVDKAAREAGLRTRDTAGFRTYTPYDPDSKALFHVHSDNGGLGSYQTRCYNARNYCDALAKAGLRVTVHGSSVYVYGWEEATADGSQDPQA